MLTEISTIIFMLSVSFNRIFEYDVKIKIADNKLTFCNEFTDAVNGLH